MYLVFVKLLQILQLIKGSKTNFLAATLTNMEPFPTSRSLSMSTLAVAYSHISHNRKYIYSFLLIQPILYYLGWSLSKLKELSSLLRSTTAAESWLTSRNLRWWSLQAQSQSILATRRRRTYTQWDFCVTESTTWLLRWKTKFKKVTKSNTDINKRTKQRQARTFYARKESDELYYVIKKQFEIYVSLYKFLEYILNKFSYHNYLWKFNWNSIICPIYTITL